MNEEEICCEYVETAIGIESMALKYHVGKKKIIAILERNGINRKSRGGVKSNVTFVVNDWKIKKYRNCDGFHYVAYDEKTNFETCDIENNGGMLTTYIEKEYGVKTPTLYDRRMYYMKTGNYWWEQWLNVRKVENKNVKKCPYCDWETVDVENKSGAFEQHLLKKHGMTKHMYMADFPEERDYFSLVSPVGNRQMEDDEDKFVTCSICGKKLARINEHHLKLHGISTEEYVREYGNALLSNEYKEIARNAGIKANMNCKPKFHSDIEKKVINFIESFGFEVKTDRKILKGKEIDIFIPSLNIAFEIDGLRWHNEITKDRNYHLNKTEQCLNNGIRLIHIFEDELEYKQNIVWSRIKNILGVTENRVYGRECMVRNIDAETSRNFLNENHIQGSTTSSIRYGLYHNNELVSVMTFGKQRKNLGRNCSDNEYELIRFCNKLDYTVVGGAGKLFKHFIKENNPKNVISYADRRWSNGSLYEKLGFTHTHNSRPNYFYVIGHKRENRFKYRKDVLVREGFDPSKSEHQIMLDRGIYRIYDCGTMVFEYVNNK